MKAFIRNLFARRTATTATTAPVLKTRLSVEGLDERLAPAVLAPVASTETTAMSRVAIPGTYIPGVYIPGVHIPGVHTAAGSEQGIVIVGGHTMGTTRGIVVSGG